MHSFNPTRRALPLRLPENQNVATFGPSFLYLIRNVSELSLNTRRNTGISELGGKFTPRRPRSLGVYTSSRRLVVTRLVREFRVLTA